MVDNITPRELGSLNLNPFMHDYYKELAAKAPDTIQCVDEAVAKHDKLYPVYITLFSNDTEFGKLIKSATSSKYTHATISLDPTMNNMYSFSHVPFTKGQIDSRGFVRESIWSPEYYACNCFTVLVTFVDKTGRDKIQAKIDNFINNYNRYNYNTAGIIQYYFGFKNTDKHDESKKLRWFCSEFVTSCVDAAGVQGWENTYVSPKDIKNLPNVIELNTYTISSFTEKDLRERTKQAEKEFRYSRTLSKHIVTESVDDDTYDKLDEAAIENLFIRKTRLDEAVAIKNSDIRKYTALVDWKALYYKFIDLFPKADPKNRFDLINLIVTKILVPMGVSAKNVTKLICDKMEDVCNRMTVIAGTLGAVSITNISADLLKSTIGFTTGDRMMAFVYPSKSTNESAITEDTISLTEKRKLAKERNVPVFICLFHFSSALSTAIAAITRDEYTHSAISFDTSLTDMYSFGKFYPNNPIIGRFVHESLFGPTYNQVTKHAVYVVFVTPEEKRIIKERLDWFVANKGKMRYNYEGLMKSLFHIPEEDGVTKYAYLCSEFVASILKSTGRDFISTPSNLVKPNDFQSYPWCYYLGAGIGRAYDQKAVDRRLAEIIEERNRGNELYLESATFGDVKKVIKPNPDQYKLQLSLNETSDSDQPKEKLVIPVFRDIYDFSHWMKSNIRYKSFDKLMAPVDTVRLKKGSCHDQVILEYQVLKQMGYAPKILFFMEYREDSDIGGRTHTTIYCTNPSGKRDASIYWFENAWGREAGVKKFDTLEELKATIEKSHADEPEAKQFPKLEFRNVSPSKMKIGSNLKDLVSDIMNESKEYSIDIRNAYGYKNLPKEPAPTTSGWYGSNHVWNSLVIKNGKRYRERVETLIYKDPGKILLRCLPNGEYKLPGGSSEPNRTLKEQAILECQEEVHITPKNLVYYGTYVKPYTKGSEYDGYLCHYFVGTYDRMYTRTVRKEDQDEKMLNESKWYYYTNAASILSDDHLNALNDYFRRALTESTEPIVDDDGEWAYSEMMPLDESIKSTVDADFSPKKKINLSSLKRVHITATVIDKYKTRYPDLKHVRCKDTKDYKCDGYMWLNSQAELVCHVGSCEYNDDHTKWIVSLEILPQFRGHGLATQILDYATKTMGCKYLSVNKSNKLAKYIYDRYGFKTYQSDKRMNYMTIDPNHQTFIDEASRKVETENVQYLEPATFSDVKNIVDKIPKKEHHYFYHGNTFKDSPCVKCRDVAYITLSNGIRAGAFLDVYTFDDAPDTGVVVIAAEPAARGHGLTDKLITKALPKLKKLGITKLIWRADIDNIHSIDLAKRHGFVDISDLKSNPDQYKLQLTLNEASDSVTVEESSSLNEFMQTSTIKSREERDNAMRKYGLRKGGYGQRTNEEDEEKMKRSAEWEKKIPLRQKKKIYREDTMLPGQEEFCDPDDVLKNEVVADDKNMENILRNWYDGWTINTIPETDDINFEWKEQPDSPWFGTIVNAGDPDKIPVSEAIDQVLVDPRNDDMVKRYTDKGYCYMPGIENRGIAQPMFKLKHGPVESSNLYVAILYNKNVCKGIAISDSINLSSAILLDGKTVSNFVLSDTNYTYSIYVVPLTEIMAYTWKLAISKISSANITFNLSPAYGVSDNPAAREICSLLICKILNSLHTEDVYFNDPYLITENSKHRFVTAKFITCGSTKSIDEKELSLITSKVLSEASVVLPFIKSFKIRIDKDGNIVINQREYNDFERHIQNSLRLLKSYRDTENYQAMKNELCRLYYMVELIDKYYSKGVKDSDYRKKLIDQRSIMLNAITNYLKLVSKNDPGFDFTNYYEHSNYGKEIKISPKGIHTIGQVIRTLL